MVSVWNPHAVNALVCHILRFIAEQSRVCGLGPDAYLMAPFEVQANTWLRPVHKPWISPVNSLTSLTFLGMARAMSHWHSTLQLQLQHHTTVSALFDTLR